MVPSRKITSYKRRLYIIIIIIIGGTYNIYRVPQIVSSRYTIDDDVVVGADARVKTKEFKTEKHTRTRVYIIIYNILLSLL